MAFALLRASARTDHVSRHLALAHAIDESASELFEECGLHVDFDASHPFARAEDARFRASLEAGNLWFALPDEGAPVEAALGFIALGCVDAQPFVYQLSVRREAMRRGVGRTLLEAALTTARRLHAGSSQPATVAVTQPASVYGLWLTTWAHLPWNQAYYERFGFRVIGDQHYGRELRDLIEEEQRWLPAPEQRRVMCCPMERA
ncbi:MAG TPA: GNAT family N-acetyltransferase [Polyangiaceae bacterium]|nr:GNAT family N-acetyltransferase [Polyangiaceae bacterium]